MKLLKITSLNYLFFLNLILKCYTLEQSGLCTLETTVRAPNVCDRSNHLVYVSEITSGCRTASNKCWCILIDNRNRFYDGDMVIELVQSHNRNDLRAGEIQYGEVKSLLTFQIVSGINRILVQPYTPPEELTLITSIKIRNNEVCKYNNNTPPSTNEFLQPNNNLISLSTMDNYYGQEYRYFSDCMRRSTYTENSFKFCPTYTPEFLIEKRFTFNNRAYWCIVIHNDNNLFTSENRLRVFYSFHNRYFVYSPVDAYIEGGEPGSNFHLGNRKTVIAISEHNYQLADIRSITIDGQSICSYSKPRARIDPPAYNSAFYTFTQPASNAPVIQPEPERPTQSIIQPSRTNINSNPVSVDHRPIVPEQNSINTYKLMKSCGIKQAHKNSLISFGTDTSPGDWPWHAAIYKLQTKTIRFFICGGTLINRKNIITAAHCVLDFNLIVIPDRLVVELGRYDLTISSRATQEYRVIDVVPHEAYNPDSYLNDIAILTLEKNVRLTPYVHYVCLPDMNVNLQNQVGTTVGWGRDHTNQMQNQLKEATLPVVDIDSCLSSNPDFFGEYLTEKNFCAGFMNNTNVCRGDSGGGLVFQSDNQWFLGGITSVGVSSKSSEILCNLMQYVLFTDVTKFITWIKRNSS